MRGDAPGRAGGSAEDGYRAARATARRRRVARVGALGAAGAGVVALLASPAQSWGWAGAIAGLVGAWWLRPAADSDRWRRGAAGERATAALLDGLPSRRWIVLHDRALPGTTANLDHVAVGPTGVWIVDTKAYRATMRPGWRSVRVGEHRVDTAPAAWEASVVAARLGFPTRPLLAVHGVGLPARGRRVAGVPVLPASALTRRLRRRRGSARLDRAEVAALGDAVARLFPPASTRRRRLPEQRPGSPPVTSRWGVGRVR